MRIREKANPAADLDFYRVSVPELREYILSKELYWGLSPGLKGAASFPQLTIGNLLLSQAKLNAVQLPPDQRNEFARLSEDVQRIHSEWLANWRLKAGQEFKSRLNLWSQYIRDLSGDTPQHASFYSTEVRQRAILSLFQLGDHLSCTVEEEKRLYVADQILHGFTQPGPFIWPPSIKVGFPETDFWFLYVVFR